MSDQTIRDRWTAHVFRADALTDAVRVALLALLPDMGDDGMVTMPRELLAERLNRAERRITDRLKDAIQAGYLERVGRAQKHRKSVYRATLPHGLSETPGGPAESYPQGFLSRTPGGPAEDSQGDTLQHPENPAPPTLSETPGGPAEPSYPQPPDRAPYKAPARALLDNPPNPKTPATAGTDTHTPNQTTTEISQSSRQREAQRWLHDRYGLTDTEAIHVVEEVQQRAPKSIRALVPYLAAMDEGDLADIAAAAMDTTDRRTRPAPAPNPADTWCGHCNPHTRLAGDPDHPRRCPACHPLRARASA